MILKYVKETVGRSAFARSVGALVSASIVGQFVMLAATPLTTRLYTPLDFGAFAAIRAKVSASAGATVESSRSISWSTPGEGL